MILPAACCIILLVSNELLFGSGITNNKTYEVMQMRKTEFIFGLCAGTAGLVLALLALFSLLPSPRGLSSGGQTYALICLAANGLGILGALFVQKNNIFAALSMAISMLVLMFFGFPWQSLPAVLYIISFVLAAVPVKAAAKKL